MQPKTESRKQVQKKRPTKRLMNSETTKWLQTQKGIQKYVKCFTGEGCVTIDDVDSLATGTNASATLIGFGMTAGEIKVLLSGLKKLKTDAIKREKDEMLKRDRAEASEKKKLDQKALQDEKRILDKVASDKKQQERNAANLKKKQERDASNLKKAQEAAARKAAELAAKKAEEARLKALWEAAKLKRTTRGAEILETRMEISEGRNFFCGDLWKQRYVIFDRVGAIMETHVEFGLLVDKLVIDKGTAVNLGKSGLLGRRHLVQV
jgi:superfamily II RNA helicase